ncbi:metallophosphoesterase family protein [Microvirga roseola]|uniref:metallophosphoesterase family protein n=1 Tax=Microvirga roseola TaxID=2883126 RepID=UPI001E465A29|nr:metallophosphoesterase [Microvirga roseola]
MLNLRLAVIGDIHHGPDSFTKRGPAALPLLERFIQQANAANVKAVVDLGDRISDRDTEHDLLLQREVAARFADLNVERHHVCGNHDLDFLSLQQNEDILDRPLGSRVVTIAGLRTLFWQPDVNLRRHPGLRLAPGDLDWLATTLPADDAPTLLVSHVPLSGQAMDGNFWFERNPTFAAYAETPAIRAVLGSCPGPLACLAGHVHWNSVTVVDGIPHFTLQSLTESFTTSGLPSEAAGVIEFSDGVLHFSVSGHDPFAVSLPFERTRRRWTAPLPPFQMEPHYAERAGD